MKKELLSPAGNFESLKAAIHNGCDAVYISGQNYGARKFANNFTLEELKEAIDYAHLYGVKVYITINTLIYENEIKDFLEYVKLVHEYGVDAVIMQDIGMIDLVHKTYPNLEIHASTQTHCHNQETINFLESLGVKRVVLARELSLNEINNIKTNLEKEAFIHGAICISYSGECLASSMILNRSGNRGECAGICRLPFELYEDNEKIKTEGNYLLSAKELSSINNLKQILDSDIKSLKIEGRMKSPEYVGYVTRIYRKLIDLYYQNKEMVLTEEEIKNLYLLYNREFTKGFINNEYKKDIVNIKTPNHQGIPLGQVLSVNKKIKILLEEPLTQNDGIRFSNNKGMIANFIYNEKGLLIKEAKKGSIIYLDNKVDLKECKKVLKTSSIKLEEELKNYQEKKLKIELNVLAKLNKELEIEIKYKNINIKEKSIIVEESKNNPTTKEVVIEKLSKINNTPFTIEKISFDIDDNIFIPIKEINNIKRILIEKLIKEIIKTKEIKINKQEEIEKKQEITNRYSFLVRNEEQIKTLINKDVDIYIENYLLYKKYKQKNVYYRTPRVNNNHIDLNNENILCTELGAVNKYNKNNNLITDIYLNIINSKSINILKNKNIKKIGLSPEIKEEDLEKINKKLQSNLELLIYGKIELMIMKYCLLNKLINKSNKCNVCINKKSYKLKDRNCEYYNIINNNCITTLLHYKNINLIDNISKYQKLGITNFRIDLFDETEKDINKILKKLSI